ncbi:hypothetical protein [Aquibacillus rhizosphaerae]|uniref:Uncharacterized protein n=1 Tax=Aquibacillus rhizosphaerae TaxID=3051431 RepID=A0ABT7KZF1_9BACI|nr:hypothetical protein [Aquibacillus sp. LR5S19]MDL4838899.1 hypothetical protein [Aquibacillus sp. LR5S19]
MLNPMTPFLRSIQELDDSFTKEAREYEMFPEVEEESVDVDIRTT